MDGAGQFLASFQRPARTLPWQAIDASTFKSACSSGRRGC